MEDKNTNGASLSLTTIEKSNLLNSDDLALINELSNELSKTFATAQIYRTRGEMEAGVLDDKYYPTIDAKYWQCVREQNMMLGALVNDAFEIEKLAIQIKMRERDAIVTNDELESELQTLEAKQLRFKMTEIQRSAHDRVRELQEWHIIKNQLVPYLESTDSNVEEQNLIRYTREFVLRYIKDNEHSNKLQTLRLIHTCNEKGVLDKMLSIFSGDKKILNVISKEFNINFIDKQIEK